MLGGKGGGPSKAVLSAHVLGATRGGKGKTTSQKRVYKMSTPKGTGRGTGGEEHKIRIPPAIWVKTTKRIPDETKEKDRGGVLRGVDAD